MRLGIIADVHANLDALTAVQADAQGRVDGWWFLGDAVGRGPDPVETVLLLREMVQPFSSRWLVGNHDLYVTKRIAAGGVKDYEQVVHDKHRQALRDYIPSAHSQIPQLWAWCRRNWRVELARPRHLEGAKIDYWLVHGLLGEPIMNFGDYGGSYLLPWDIAWHKPDVRVQINELRKLKRPDRPIVLLHGHTHVPYIAAVPYGGDPFTPYLLPIHYDQPLVLKFFGDVLFINPGSVGQPRNGDERPHAAYGILDLEQDTFEFRRVYYDCRRVCRRMRAQNYSKILIQILEGNHVHNSLSDGISEWIKWRHVYESRPWGWEPITQKGA